MKVAKRKTKKGIINGAIKLLSDKSHWGQGANGQDKNGQIVDIDNPRAVRFCLQGAIQKCAVHDAKIINEVLACVDDVARRNYNRGIISVNDFEGYEVVMEILNKSLKVCK